MDRFDEKRDASASDEPARAGDVLGLGGSTVPKSPEDPHANDPDEVAKRRERAREDVTTPRGPEHSHPGATGIDMGYGGEGTDLSGE
jgi:hypothetical protein